MQKFFSFTCALFIAAGAFADPLGLSVIALGDWGIRGRQFQPAVAAMMAQYADENKVDFAVITGDNFYPDGVASVTDSHFSQSFEQVYSQPSLTAINWWVALGNHDYRGNVGAQIEYGKINRRWKLPKRYYSRSFKIRGVSADFFFLDTTPMIPSYYSNSLMADELAIAGSIEEQKRWLRKGLRASKADWQIVVGHHPMYSSSPGRGGEQSVVQQQLHQIFQTRGVDLYISGHDHDLQLHKHPDYRTFQIVSGGGHQARALSPGPYALFAKSSPGFAAVNLRRRKFEVKYLNHLGETLFAQTYRR